MLPKLRGFVQYLRPRQYVLPLFKVSQRVFNAWKSHHACTSLKIIINKIEQDFLFDRCIFYIVIRSFIIFFI